MFLKSWSTISPQPSWSNDLKFTPTIHSGNILKCLEPDYAEFLNSTDTRRMSRILKMSASTALKALLSASIASPDKIIAGTGLGCLEDTGLFLKKMIESAELFLNPTPFIHSTHNTLSSKIAIQTRCYGYNATYTQTAFSFELALIDAQLHLKETPAQNILVGATDEITELSQNLMSEFKMFKKEPIKNYDLFKTNSSGTLNGEGSAWFVASGVPKNSDIEIVDVFTIFRQPKQDIVALSKDFIHRNGIKKEDVDLVLGGFSGDNKLDTDLEKWLSSIFEYEKIGKFKHLCGEYHTSSSFALWLGCQLITSNSSRPEITLCQSEHEVKKILIFNSYFNSHITLILIRKYEE